MIHKRPGDKRKSEDQEKGRGDRVQSAPEGKKNLVGAFLPPLSSSPKRLLMCLFEISTGVGVREKKGENNGNAMGKEGGCVPWDGRDYPWPRFHSRFPFAPFSGTVVIFNRNSLKRG